MTDMQKRALELARKRVLRAKDRESAIRAYKHWHDLKAIFEDEYRHNDGVRVTDVPPPKPMPDTRPVWLANL